MAETCYRHPNRETAVACSSCGRPICPDCMTSTSVGMRCPECAKQKTQVRSGAGAFSGAGRAPATFVLIAINVVVFLAEMFSGGGGTVSGTGDLVADGGLFGPAIDQGGDWYRVFTSGFLHAGLIHLGFNMYILYIAGNLLEPGIGTPRFLGIYFVSMLGGSAGALLLTPNEVTVGASGAIFGLMAAVLVVARGRGVDELVQQFGLFIALNLVITFAIPNISIGGHIGGLIAGGVAAAVFVGAERTNIKGSQVVAFEAGAILFLAAGMFIAALSFAAG